MEIYTIAIILAYVVLFILSIIWATYMIDNNFKEVTHELAKIQETLSNKETKTGV